MTYTFLLCVNHTYDNMVKFRIMSDLHLEFYTRVSQLERHIQWTDDDKNCHLILAGDIGNPLTAKKRRGPCNYKPNGFCAVHWTGRG